MDPRKKKKKGYHRVNVDKVSHYRRRLWTMEACYDPNIPHGLSVSLTMYIKVFKPLPLQAIFQE